MRPLGEPVDYVHERADPFGRAMMFVHLVQRGQPYSEAKFWEHMTDTERLALCMVLAGAFRETEWSAAKLETRWRELRRRRASGRSRSNREDPALLGRS